MLLKGLILYNLSACNEKEQSKILSSLNQIRNIAYHVFLKGFSEFYLET